MCTPHKALRNTIKAYLKTAEKKLAEEKAKIEASQTPVVETPGSGPTPITGIPEDNTAKVENFDAATALAPSAVEPEPNMDNGAGLPAADEPQPSVEV